MPLSVAPLYLCFPACSVKRQGCFLRSILDAINEWIKEILIRPLTCPVNYVRGRKRRSQVYRRQKVGQTRREWNAGIFSMIQSLSENQLYPLQGLSLPTFYAWSLSAWQRERTTMHDIDTFMFFRVVSRRG